MVFTFARDSAACGVNVADLFHQQRRSWVRLHEKGNKFHEMPCHHTLEGYLSEYIERAQLGEAGRAPLFQAIKRRPASPPKSATTPSAARALPPTLKTVARSRRRARWRRMRRPAQRSSTIGARTASHSMKW